MTFVLCGGFSFFGISIYWVADTVLRKQESRLLSETSNLVVYGVDVVKSADFTSGEMLEARIVALNGEAFVHLNLTC
jgi:hypothetical protein